MDSDPNAGRGLSVRRRRVKRSHLRASCMDRDPKLCGTRNERGFHTERLGNHRFTCEAGFLLRRSFKIRDFDHIDANYSFGRFTRPCRVWGISTRGVTGSENVDRSGTHGARGAGIQHSPGDSVATGAASDQSHFNVMPMSPGTPPGKLTT